MIKHTLNQILGTANLDVGSTVSDGQPRDMTRQPRGGREGTEETSSAELVAMMARLRAFPVLPCLAS